VISVAAIIATGVNPRGKREILGLGIGLSEAKECWIEFLRSLVARGLAGVQLVISDGHAELKATIAQVLGTTTCRPYRETHCAYVPEGIIGYHVPLDLSKAQPRE
jgi:transposase-like protein